MIAEEATFPTIEIAGRSFVVGPVTLYQLFAAKNFVVDLVKGARRSFAERGRLREAEAAKDALRHEDQLRLEVANRLKVDVKDIPEAQMVARTQEWVSDFIEREADLDGEGSSISAVLDFIGSLSEDQICELGRLILSRTKTDAVTKSWVSEHFELNWFLDVLATFLEHNDLASIVKNFQRLGTAISTQSPRFQPTEN